MTDFGHRKTKSAIHVKTMNGEPVKNAKIEIRQKSHEFLFGCGAFDIQAYTMDLIPGKRDLFEKKTELWLDVFNYATIPVYWALFEHEEDKPFILLLENTLSFLKEKNVVIKGHPLCWHTLCPEWLLKYDNPTILEKLLKRIDRDVSCFAGSIDIWDVINEVVIMPKFDKYDNAMTRICNEYGQVELVKKVFAEARKINPEAKLLINDFNTSKAYEELIERCLDAGVEFSAIGIQSHQHQGYWGLDKLHDVLQRFSRFGIPLHFTENTILSGEPVPPEIEDLNDWKVEEWPTLPELEEEQSEQLEEMYTVLFDHPLVEAITQWDLTDGAWLHAPSGLIRTNNTDKPAYRMLKKKIKDEWFTKSYNTVTDDNGVALVEGFKGRYDLIINGQTQELILDGRSDELTVIID
ncbi:MAG: endo-1,4-beta-xylanase [Clostridiales bacterium]|nr:endo-1,4-beta-xylanase [Clostridiales bacterium]